VPLRGEYAPSPSTWARDQDELFERSGGTEGATLRGMPIVVLTSVGARTGKLRKTPLMRVEHGGEYAVVASLGGAPNAPQSTRCGTTTSRSTRTLSCRTGRSRATSWSAR
jgi:hypothetical protein